MAHQRRTTNKKPSPGRYVQPYRYPSPNIPLAAIRRFARQVAERFQPEKIILFGSYAYGKPHQDSDVDILVVMPAYDEINQAVRIRQQTDHLFPLDLIVRTPENLSWRMEEGDWFLRESVGKGKVLYEKTDGRVDAKSRKRPAHRKNPGRGASISSR